MGDSQLQTLWESGDLRLTEVLGELQIHGTSLNDPVNRGRVLRLLDERHPTWRERVAS
jgi:hypothetical protein